MKRSSKRFRLYSYNPKCKNFAWWDTYEKLTEARHMCKVWFKDSPSDYLVFDTVARVWFVYRNDTDTLWMV